MPSALHDPQTLIEACQVRQTWAARDRFTVLDLAFGSAEAFLATWAAWQHAVDRPARLLYAALLPTPLSRTELRTTIASLRAISADAPDVHAAPQRAPATPGLPAEPSLSALLDRWPSLSSGIHRVVLDAGRVQLTLAVGDPLKLLPGWIPRCDALFVPGHAAPLPTALLREASLRLATEGWAGSDSNDAALGAALQACGLSVFALPATRARGATGSGLRAQRTRGHRTSVTPPRPSRREAIVIGAGLAGAACAHALAQRDWQVIRLDAFAAADPVHAAGVPAAGHAQAGSFQPVLAQHPAFTPDDAPMSRLTRAALSLSLGPWAHAALRRTGRIQLCAPDLAAAAVHHWPRDWVQAVDAHAASEHAGVALARGGLWMPVAAHADPAELIAGWSLPGITVLHGQAHRLVRGPDGWTVCDARGHVLAQAPQVIIAAGAAALDLQIEDPASDAAGTDPSSGSLASAFGASAWQIRRGRVTLARLPPRAVPRCIVGGTGHAVPVDAHTLLLGPADADEPITGGAAPHTLAERAWTRHLAHLGTPAAGADPHPTPLLSALAPGQRLSVRDHLPLVGGIPDRVVVQRDRGALQRNDRLPIPMLDGLWMVGALGGRGLLWSILAAEVLASRLEAEPAPIDHRLIQAISTDRFLRRSLRHGDPGGNPFGHSPS